MELEQLVGEHECTEIPPSLFGPTGDLRHSNKFALIKLLMDETKVHTVDDLPYEENLASAVITPSIDGHFDQVKHFKMWKDVT